MKLTVEELVFQTIQSLNDKYVSELVDMDILKGNTKNTIINALQDRVCEKTYFHHTSDAMEYLMKNDVMLTESCMLADESGYTLDNINSCVLANLLYNKEYIDSINRYEDDIILLSDFVEYIQVDLGIDCYEVDKYEIDTFDETIQEEVLDPYGIVY